MKKNMENRVVNEEIYISVDVEAAGPIPSEYSMLSIGASVVGSPEKNYYVELKPINTNVIPEAIAIGGFSIQQLEISGKDPTEAMNAFENWVKNVSGNKTPVFVGFNTPFDWQFINWYFHQFLGKNPFGISAIDIKAYYMGYVGCVWADTSSSRLPSWLQPTRKQRHNALDDAITQGEIFARLVSARSSNSKK
jgi:DNA polymerase III epsilon subunit-like protein